MTIYQEIDFAVPGVGELAGEFGGSPVATPGYRDAVLAYGPIAYWTLDDAAGGVLADAMGQHPLSVSGVVELGQASANRSAPGAAVRFNGGSAVASGPVLPTDASAAFTLIAWVRRNELTETGEVLGQFNSNDDGRILLRLLAGGGVRYRVVADSAVEISGPAIGLDWIHLAIVRDGAHLSMYINGQLEITVSNQFSPIAPAPFSLGKSILAVDCLLDEVAVLDVALTADQLLALYRYAASLPGRSPEA